MEGRYRVLRTSKSVRGSVESEDNEAHLPRVGWGLVVDDLVSVVRYDVMSFPKYL